MIELSVVEFLQLAASKTPVPGGGSISALSGALGCAMGHMAAIFSTSEKYAEVSDEINQMLDQYNSAVGEFAGLVEADAQAYDGFSNAMKMPKNTEAEKAKRAAAMQMAIQEAITTPRKICHLAIQMLEVTASLVEIGNKNLISDVGVCSTMLRSAFDGARLNVEINLAYLKDAEAVAALREEMDKLAEEATTFAATVYEKTLAHIRK